MNLVIFGAGGHAKVAIEAVQRQGTYTPHALIDELSYGHSLYGIPVKREIDETDDISFIVAIGDNKVRKEKYERCLSRGWRPATIIHPTAVVAGDVTVGRGTVIFAGAIINAATTIGENCIINTGATIDHDCRIGSHVHVAPGCHLAGDITIGEGTLLGIGAVAIPKVKIGSWVIAGAGAAIVDNVEDRDTVAGVPARTLKRNLSSIQLS